MKQPEDNKTAELELPQPAKRGRGRPRKWNNQAERLAAYRAKLRDDNNQSMVTLSLPVDLVELLDHIAALDQVSRSDIVATMIQEYKYEKTS